jgi:aspartate/methionine/tyrosine aminotransferase
MLRAHPRVIRVASLSKQLSVPGMKVGWILAARDLVDDFYEYASTIYGGPASFFYSLIDVYATFEQIRQSGTDAVTGEGLRGIAERYELPVSDAGTWYAQYDAEQDARGKSFAVQRSYAIDRLRAAGYQVTSPRYSVNCTVAIPGHSSYGFFRDALDQVGVSVYPNILAFDLADRSVRITLGRDFGELKLALDRLSQVTSRGCR